MVLTSTVPGVGLRKSPTSHSLVHTLVSLLTREQHQAPVPAKALTLLSHCCQAQECRTVIAKVREVSQPGLREKPWNWEIITDL